MVEFIKMVREFHINGQLEVNHAPTPLQLDSETGQLRLRLHEEEGVIEYAEALADGDGVAQLDALADLAYVLFGSVVSNGFTHVFEEAFREVHRSNMSKFVDGKFLRDEGGKVLKPDTYTPPDLEKVLEGYNEVLASGRKGSREGS